MYTMRRLQQREDIMRTYEEKKKALYDFMNTCIEEDICIAFSGGVDSSVLLQLARNCAEKEETEQYLCSYLSYHASPFLRFGDCTESGKRSGSYT